MSDLEILRQEIIELKAINLMAQKEALNIDDASLLTGLSKQTLYDLCHSKSIPYYKSCGGKKTYFKKSELNDWMLHTKVSTQAEIDSQAIRRIYL